MYIPASFRESRIEVLHEFMRTHPFGLLICAGDGASAAAAAAAPNKATTDKLIQLLIKKGLITPQEAQSLSQP